MLWPRRYVTGRILMLLHLQVCASRVIRMPVCGHAVVGLDPLMTILVIEPCFRDYSYFQGSFDRYLRRTGLGN
ncbi:hypothetical protein F4805DRAFT_371330 [Annulohypoxylon moriforme]|nr:hypothetical protein F4805DRAFT_371330 [Annulohypoxylon moriforme]